MRRCKRAGTINIRAETGEFQEMKSNLFQRATGVLAAAVTLSLAAAPAFAQDAAPAPTLDTGDKAWMLI